MRQIVDGNEGLNIMLNHIVDYEINKTLDEMIAIVEAWKQNMDTVTCATVIALLEANKTT